MQLVNDRNSNINFRELIVNRNNVRAVKQAMQNYFRYAKYEPLEVVNGKYRAVINAMTQDIDFEAKVVAFQNNLDVNFVRACLEEKIEKSLAHSANNRLPVPLALEKLCKAARLTKAELGDNNGEIVKNTDALKNNVESSYFQSICDKSVLEYFNSDELNKFKSYLRPTSSDGLPLTVNISSMLDVAIGKKLKEIREKVPYTVDKADVQNFRSKLIRTIMASTVKSPDDVLCELSNVKLEHTKLKHLPSSGLLA